MLNMGSTAPELSTASGQPGPSGPIAPEPAEEGSCTESAPAPARGRPICTQHNILLIFLSEAIKNIN